jgi:O-antigen ligase
MSADVIASPATSKYAPLAVIGVILGAVVIRLAKRWSWLVACILVTMIVIPNDGRYILAAHLPIQMEPYRVVVGAIVLGWLVALLVDPRVRMRASKLDGPIGLILLATLGSEVANPQRVAGLSSYVIKSMWLFATIIFVFYLIVSVVRSRAVVERLLTVLVVAGGIEAIGAVYQRRSGYNIFNSLHFLLPGFTFTGLSGAGNQIRGGFIRATGAAGDPIELAATMAMVLPLSVYLAVSRRQRRWWFVTLALVGGDFAGGSRTGIISLAVIALTFLMLRPRQTLRCWPALIPALALVHVVAPGAIGGIRAGFFPTGGLIAQQSHVFIARGGVADDNTRLSRWGPSINQYLQHNPLVGDGFGTRVTGYLANGKLNPDDNATVLDDQWLGTLLETGLVGVIAWVWLFGRVIRRLVARAKEERGSPEGWLPVALAASLASFATSMFFYDALAFIQATCVMFILLALASIVLQLPPTRKVTLA